MPRTRWRSFHPGAELAQLGLDPYAIPADSPCGRGNFVRPFSAWTCRSRGRGSNPGRRRSASRTGILNLGLRSWQQAQWQQWQHSAFVQVRSRSPARTETPANRQCGRTGANRHERPPALAMQKVVGSSPIIRFEKAPQIRGFCRPRSKRSGGVAAKWLHSLPRSAFDTGARRIAAPQAAHASPDKPRASPRSTSEFFGVIRPVRRDVSRGG